MLTKKPHESEDPFAHLELVATDEFTTNSASRLEIDDVKSMKNII